MKVLLAVFLLLLSVTANATPPACAIEAVRANQDLLRFYTTRIEARNYVETWCAYGRKTAETYLANVIDEKVDLSPESFNQIYEDNKEERRHQEIVQAIRDAGDPCSRSMIPEYCRAKRQLREFD